MQNMPQSCQIPVLTAEVSEFDSWCPCPRALLTVFFVIYPLSLRLLILNIA